MARFYLRFPAFLIDLIVVILPLSVVFAFVLAYQYPQYVNNPQFIEGLKTNEKVQLYIQIGMFFVLCLYNSICESGRLQGSVGKYIFRLAVVDELGYAISFGQAFRRNIGKVFYFFLPLFGPILFVISLITSKRRQGLHDMISRSFVVSKNL